MNVQETAGYNGVERQGAVNDYTSTGTMENSTSELPMRDKRIQSQTCTEWSRVKG